MLRLFSVSACVPVDVQQPGSSCSPAAARTADKHERSSLLRAAHLRRIRAKAEDESRKVDEVSFINSLTTAGRKADLQQRLEDGEQIARQGWGVHCSSLILATQPLWQDYT